jgi:hypothetical protein
MCILTYSGIFYNKPFYGSQEHENKNIGVESMELREFLEQVNVRLLRQLAEENNWPLSLLEEEDAASRLASYVKDEKTIAAIWESLSSSEKQVLTHFLFAVGHDILTYRQMEEYARLSSPLVAYSGLTGLRRRGLVYTLRRLWGEVAYCIPYDVQKALRRWLLAHAFPEEAKEPIFPAIGMAQAGTQVSQVLFRLLLFHRYQPITLTKKGIMTMKVRRQWQDMIPYSESLFAALPSIASSDDMAREVFFLELLLHMKVLRKQETDAGMQYVVDEQQVAEWFHGREIDVQRRLYEAVKEKISQLHPLYPVMMSWLEARYGQRSTLDIVQQKEQKWLSIIEAERKALWQMFWEHVCPLFTAFGFARYEETTGEFQWNPGVLIQPSRQEQVSLLGTGYVQPTFEILLLPNAPYEVRWELGKYAVLEEQQEVWTFALTRESVQMAARQAQVRAEDLLHLLKQIQPEIPENVREQLMQWMRKQPCLQLERVTVLRCPDVDTANWLAADPELSLFWKERLNERDFIVEETKQEEVARVLTQKSMQIQTGTKESKKVREQSEPDASASVLTENGYKVESVFPELEDALPELRNVPAIWYKNFQRYHHSTLRNLLSTACSLGISLSVEIGNQKVEAVRVLEMKEEHGQYCLRLQTPNQQTSVSLEQIGRIRLEVAIG